MCTCAWVLPCDMMSFGIASEVMRSPPRALFWVGTASPHLCLSHTPATRQDERSDSPARSHTQMQQLVRPEQLGDERACANTPPARPLLESRLVWDLLWAGSHGTHASSAMPRVAACPNWAHGHTGHTGHNLTPAQDMRE